MLDHISRTCQSCFYHLRLGRDVTTQLVCALVLSRLAEQCKSTCGLLGLYTRASSAGSTWGHLVNDLNASDHVTSTLVDLHWLPIKQRVDYKLFCHNVSIGRAPAYLSEMLIACFNVPSFSKLRTSSSGDYVIPRTSLKLSERAFAVLSLPLSQSSRELKKTKCTTTCKRLI